MVENLQNNFTDGQYPPAFSADDGWKQMSALLDQHLPRQPTGSGYQFRLSISKLLVLCAILCLLFPLHINKNNRHLLQVTDKPQVYIPSPFEMDDQEKIPAMPHEKNIKSVLLSGYDITGISPGTSSTVTASPELSTFRYLTDSILIAPIGNRNDNIIRYSPAPKRMDVNKNSLRLLTSAGTGEVHNRKELSPGKWQFRVGVASNFSLGDRQDLQPYPKFDVRYSIGKRLSLSAGISLLSPVSVEALTGVKRTLYANDTINNVSSYSEIYDYSRLIYIDVPVMMNWQLSKHVSLKGGLQLSRLVSSDFHTNIEQYDFNSVRTNSYSGSLQMPNAPVIENDIKVRKMDYRILTGLEYRINETVHLDLLYQKGLRPVMTGNDVTNKNNSLITLQVNLKLK